MSNKESYELPLQEDARSAKLNNDTTSPDLNLARLEGTESSLQLFPRHKPAKAVQPANFSQESAADLILLLRLDNSNENVSVLRSAIARGYNVRDVFLAGLSALDDRDILSSIPLPDPNRNTLTLVRTSTLQAYLSIATSLRIPIDELYLPTCPSPFYQPGLTTSIFQHQELIASYTTTIPHNLLPIPLQITVPHHPWLDLIPFPILGERVLSLLSMTPPMIDLLDLKGDIFISDGIFCWRSGKKGGLGQPREARNWEAEAWFLKKWWMLVGGEGGDLWKQTEWWRCVRGMEKVRMGWEAED
ncbi:hypothetical protein VTL71DRAFT_15125 [Oculimacula yallundae]|uniref:Uncharacterized protein n=1 Tax=Oculimacula yallundae TaxID=86028 RepID=A0ABR4CGF5_9HELO